MDSWGRQWLCDATLALFSLRLYGRLRQAVIVWCYISFILPQVVWTAETGSDCVMLSHVSPDGDEGYPGEVHINVTYQLTDDNELMINYTATTRGKATPINLTSHPYFNLAGQVSQQPDLWPLLHLDREGEPSNWALMRLIFMSA